MRRLSGRARIGALGLVAAVLLTGCGGTSTTQTGARINANEKVNLTMWGLFDAPSVWQPIIQQYQSQHPNVTISYEQKTFADYQEDSLNALAARTGPDIWLVRNDWLAQHADKLVAAPAGLFAGKTTSALAGFKTTFPDVVYQDAVVGDKIFGVPLSVDTLVLYYNKVLFQEKRGELDRSSDHVVSGSNDLRQAPITWNDAIRYANLLTKRDGNRLTQAGLALGSPNVVAAHDILTALMLQRGTTLVAADRKSAAFNLPQIDSSGRSSVPGNDALQFWQSFTDSGSANFAWSADFPDSISAFEQSKVAMIVHYGFLQNQLEQDVPTLQFGIYPLPQIAGATTPVDYASYWLETVTNSSKNPAVAWDFLAFALQNASSYQQAAGRPGNTRPVQAGLPPTMPDRATHGLPLDFQRASATSWYKGLRPIKTDELFNALIRSVSSGTDSQKALDATAAQLTALLQGQTPTAAASTSK